jgi:hypothetical protein
MERTYVSQVKAYAIDEPMMSSVVSSREPDGKSGSPTTSVLPKGRRRRSTLSPRAFGRIALALVSGGALVALLPASPAQAMVAGGFFAGGPSCSAAQQVTGGGVAVVGQGSADFHTRIDGFSTDFLAPGGGGTWLSVVRNTDGVSHPIGLFAVCVNSIAGYQIVSKDLTVAAGGFVRDIATCPVGTVALGGGVDDLGFLSNEPASADRIVQESAPSTLGGQSVWMGAVHNNDTVAHPVSVFAVCANAPSGYQVVHKDLTLAAGGFVRDSALCPAGSVVFGGGAAVVRSGSADFKTQFQESAPGTAGGQSLWLTAMRNNDSVSHTISLYAVCASSLPGYQVVRGDA